MADLSGLTTNYFATPKEGFTTTLASTISSGATTVPLNSITGYTNGAIATMVVEPTSVTAKQVFTGVVDTAGIQLTSVKWTEGTNQSHAAGSTVVDYVTATHMAALVKGLTTSTLDQDGTLKAGAVDNAAAIANAVVTVPKLTTELQKGWEDSYGSTTFPAPNTVTYNGNRSYDLVFNSVDLTSSVSNGMRLKCTRTVTAPTQCADLESGSSQYFSKTSPAGMTFTDDFTCMGWVKLESYGATGGIIARRNADTEGWCFEILSDGRVQIGALRIAGNNAFNTSYQSIPLNKWVHVAASYDLSGVSGLIYIDGVLVPSANTVTGTITALVQGTTALVVGASKSAGTSPFDGKIAQAAVFSSVLSAATIRSYMSQTLSGAESTNVSAFSLNGVLTDLNANANTLTANGGALATNADSPFGIQADGTTAGTTEYAIITKTAFSTNTTITVQVPEGCALPTSGGISAVSYSTQKVPYGFPADRGKWRLWTLQRTQVTTTSNATFGSYSSGGFALTVPIGAWDVGYNFVAYSTTIEITFNLSPTSIVGVAAGSEDINFSTRTASTGAGNTLARFFLYRPQNVTSQSTYVIYTHGASVNGGIDGDNNLAEIFAEFSLL
jgi:hypothetical protein